MNPFKFGQIVTGPDFADREAEIKEAVSALESGQSILIHSPRRYGKTSLIKEVIRQLRTKGYQTVYMDLYKITSKKNFVEVYSAAIVSAAESKLQEAFRLLQQYLPRPRITIPEGPLPFEVEISASLPKRDEAQLFNDVLEMPQKLAKKKAKRIIVVFDEFQEIRRLDGEEIERTMRSIFQHHGQVSYAFLGSRRTILGEMFGGRNRPFYKFCKSLPLGPIPSKEFAKFIKQHFENEGFRTPSTIIEEILGKTESHPYYTQQLCYELWNVVYPSRSAMTEKEWVKGLEEAVKRVISSNSYAYEETYDHLGDDQRRLITALATEPSKSIYGKDYIQRHGLGRSQNVSKACKNLEDRDLIEKSEGVYRVSDVFLREWLKKR